MAGLEEFIRRRLLCGYQTSELRGTSEARDIESWTEIIRVSDIRLDEGTRHLVPWNMKKIDPV